MSILSIAEARARHADDPQAFRWGFFRGLDAAETHLDAEMEYAALTGAGDFSAAAGLIEGLAAARAEAGWSVVPHPRYRNDHRKHRQHAKAGAA